MTVFRGYIFSQIRHRNAAKNPKLPKNDRSFQNNIFRGYKFSRTVSKTAKSAKLNTNKVMALQIQCHSGTSEQVCNSGVQNTDSK